MKKNNKKLTTLILAGAVCCTSIIGAALIKNPVKTSAADVKYALTDVFASNGADAIGAAKQNSADKAETAKFTLANNQYVRIKRDVALKWFAEDKNNKGKGVAQYFTMKFALADLNFQTLDVVMESESSLASEDGKANNVVTLKNEGGAVKAAVVADGTDAKDAVYKDTEIAANAMLTLFLKEEGTEEHDEFTVVLNDGKKDIVLGKFENVGANFGEYNFSDSSSSNDSMYPLQFKATTKDNAKTAIFFGELNNQKFDNITTDGGVKKVKDTAAPVLVVNQQLNGFQIGSAFSLEYEKVDVLQSSSLSETKTYYQYDPEDTAINYDKTLTTSTYFMKTVYKKDGQDTTVYKENDGKEFVSIHFTLGDNAFNVSDEKSEYAKATYDLAWYATRTEAKTLGSGEKAVTTDYLILDKNSAGATYSYIKADADKAENLYLHENGGVEEYKADYAGSVMESQVNEFNKQLAKAAGNVFGGSNDYIYFPSFDWLFDDDNGYRNLKFTISYKTSSATAKNSSNLSYNGLKLSAAEEGLYEFKILAYDEANNGMKYYLDGELVEVTTANVWDIEEIPTFSYEIKNQGIKIKNEEEEDAEDRTDTAILDDNYSFSGVTVVGCANQKTEYALYKINLDAYNTKVDKKLQLTSDDLSAITYKQLREKAATKLTSVSTTYNGDYFKMYIAAYSELLAENTERDAAKIALCFERIDAYNEKITEEDAAWAMNKFEWQKSSSSSFTTAEEGEYLVLADYWDELLPTVSRATAYKIVTVESKADVIKGETEWLKNNLVSVILFSVAAVMLVLIIILLLIKPSDETLEDVDKQAAKKKETKKKSK